MKQKCTKEQCAKKLCKHCGKYKDISEFTVDKRRKDGLNRYCKECISWYNKETRHRSLGMGRWNPFKVIDEEEFYLNWQTLKDGVKNWATGACTRTCTNKGVYYDTVKNYDKIVYDR